MKGGDDEEADEYADEVAGADGCLQLICSGAVLIMCDFG